MSLAGLVEYGSSDESENEDIQDVNKIEENGHEKNNTVDVIKIELKNATINGNNEEVSRSVPTNPKWRLGSEKDELVSGDAPQNLFLNSLPKPKNAVIDDNIIEEKDDIPMPKKNFPFEKPPKKEKGPVKISIPSLSDFDDLNEGDANKKSRPQPSKKLSGVLALLPPPQDELISTANLVPHVLTKLKTVVKTSLTPTQIKNQVKNRALEKNTNNSKEVKLSSVVKLDSDSEDEDDRKIDNKARKSMDFFSLSESINLPLSEEVIALNMLPMEEKRNLVETITKSSTNYDENAETSSDGKKLTSVVMDLPREEIILKNKAEVGPKLPVPEQEFNIDAEGNVAFDEKAIEYLCGKRGVKRKNQLINEVDIIDISGEDIKPDEREWLVKALTEEPVPRPVSLKNTGSGQSKKKHQITYLAEQAKAMEIELKNQWAANRLARRQTKSKYGF